MAKFTSENLAINNTTRNIFDFLSDFNNFEKLMPEQVTNWKSSHSTCSFTIQGMADISMKIENTVQDEKVHMKSEEAPFDFDMVSYLEKTETEQTNVRIELEAQINPMMLMMVKRPLQNLVNIMVEKLKEEMEKKQ
ncbi:MAG: SRPBCC family protein [Bacteroidota bacterium]|nr:SRPBCC family protein [Bacteroidota bacterium]